MVSVHGVLLIGSCDGSALPVIMSITGPREPYDYRDYNLLVPGITKPKQIE